MGFLVLQGGAEFGGLMKISDLRALALAGGSDAVVSIIPAAAAPDNNHERAGENGRRWFESLGASRVSVIPLIDRPSAEDARIVDALRQSKLIYLLGGFPGYLVKCLAGSPAWAAMKAALAQDGVLAGSSAGAMVMAEYLYDPATKQVVAGLGLLSQACVLPHHNAFGRRWSASLQRDLPGATLIGIDEETGLINDAGQGRWKVYGRGGVTCYRQGLATSYKPGATLTI